MSFKADDFNDIQSAGGLTTFLKTDLQEFCKVSEYLEICKRECQLKIHLWMREDPEFEIVIKNDKKVFKLSYTDWASIMQEYENFKEIIVLKTDEGEEKRRMMNKRFEIICKTVNYSGIIILKKINHLMFFTKKNLGSFNIQKYYIRDKFNEYMRKVFDYKKGMEIIGTGFEKGQREKRIKLNHKLCIVNYLIEEKIFDVSDTIHCEIMARNLDFIMYTVACKLLLEKTNA